MRKPVGKPTGRRTWLLLLGLLLLLPVCPTPAQQQRSPRPAPLPKDPIDTAKAEVSILSDQLMDFGQLADKDGSVVLGLTDEITSDPDFIHYGGSEYSGICTISGDPSTAVDISISTTPANGLTLSTFTSSEGGLPLISVLLDPSGELVLTIGATLTVDAATASIGPGQTVSYTITSTYN